VPNVPLTFQPAGSVFKWVTVGGVTGVIGVITSELFYILQKKAAPYKLLLAP
jgi:hypothetical protein